MLGAGDDGPASISLSPGVDVELLGRSYPSMALMGLDVLDATLSPIAGV